jgi:hypothetical protein
MIMNSGRKPYRLDVGRGGGERTTVNLVQANDGDAGDDFEGGRNWTFMLVLFAAFAGVSSSAVWSLL